jgi:hypothetical protein
MDLRFWSARQHLGWAYEQKTMYEEAITDKTDVAQQSGEP